MQPPNTPDELLTLATKGKLLDAARANAIREKLASAQPPITEASRLAEMMVRQQIITRFQADQLLQGRSKGFWVKRYKILDQVGVGGMARVFLAEHAIMRRKVALKVLPTSKCADPPSLARFLREARAIASINHPNVIRAYDIDQDADFYYIVLEFAEGLTVAQWVDRHGPIPWPQSCDYVYQAAAGLEHLAGCGLIHRDIKPSNVIIDRSGTIKLVDLGLAVFFEEKEKDPLTLRYDQNVLGTADYLAPEQAIDSHNVDSRADVYSLGATFCFMLTGEPPFPGGTIGEKLHAHQTEPFGSIRKRAPDVSKDLDAILQKMLAKRPEDRFQTMTELRNVLRPFLPQNSVSAHLSGTFAMLNGQRRELIDPSDSDAARTIQMASAGEHGFPQATPTPKSDVRLSGVPASENMPSSTGPDHVTDQDASGDDDRSADETASGDETATKSSKAGFVSRALLMGAIGGTAFLGTGLVVSYLLLY